MNPTMLAVMHCNPHHRLHTWRTPLGGVYRNGDIITAMTRQSRFTIVGRGRNPRDEWMALLLVSPSVYAWRQLP